MNDIPIFEFPDKQTREDHVKINGEEISAISTPEAFRQKIMELMATNERLKSEKDAITTEHQNLQAKHYELKLTMQKLADNNRTLAKEAFEDEMTGLSNRRGLKHKADAFYAEATQHEILPKYCMAIFDLRGLGKINNEQGHDAGDAYLKSFVAHINAHLRPDDTLARWGGDEFAVMLPNSSEADARAIMDSINADLPDSIKFRAGYAASEDLAKIYGRTPTFREVVDIADLAQNDAKMAEKKPEMGVAGNTVSLGDVMQKQ